MDHNGEGERDKPDFLPRDGHAENDDGFVHWHRQGQKEEKNEVTGRKQGANWALL